MHKALFCCCLLILAAHAYNNGACKTPPMGWNSWNLFQCNISESLIVQTIDSFEKQGLKNLGYEYVILDDCWQAEERDINGALVADPQRFPHGIKYLADYAHGKGLKLGIYSDVGLKTCQGFPGSYNYYQKDADTFAAWGIDYLKLDYCHLAPGESTEPWKYYIQMSDALNKTGRPVCFSICNWGFKNSWEWAPAMAQLWRTTLDIYPQWKHVMHILDQQIPLAKFAKPYAFNDPDMLEVGVTSTIGNLPHTPKTNLTERESLSHYSLWAIVAAPFILGNDVREMKPWVQEIITNKEVIAIDQDELVQQGTLVKEYKRGIVGMICIEVHCLHTQVWARNLTNNRVAVVLLNRGGPLSQYSAQYRAETIEAHWQDLHITGKFLVRDVWAHKDLGTFENTFTSPMAIEQHGSMTLILTPVQ